MRRKIQVDNLKGLEAELIRLFMNYTDVAIQATKMRSYVEIKIGKHFNVTIEKEDEPAFNCLCCIF